MRIFMRTFKATQIAQIDNIVKNRVKKLKRTGSDANTSRSGKLEITTKEDMSVQA